MNGAEIKLNQAIRRIWSFSKALDLALVDEGIQKGLELEIGYHHGERVGYISIRLGYLLGMRGKELFFLLVAGLMHDIGAVGGFSAYHGDYRLMEKHSELGAEIISRLPFGGELSEAIRYHHQTPRTHQNDLLMAKIISLADKADIFMGRSKNTYDDRARVAAYVKSLLNRDFYPEVGEAFLQLAEEEAFWLDLNQGELLESTLDFLIRRNGNNICTDLGEVCSLIYGEVFTERLAEVFAYLIDQKSTFTGRHSRTVSENVSALAEGLGWDKEQCRDIKLAGLLHDLGKLAIPQKILDKPGSLNDDEVQIIRTHTYYSYKLLSSAGFSRRIVEWAAYHHERLDGRGYPFRVPADSLTMGSRLMAIADIYSALTEDRPYREGLAKAKAMEIIEKGINKSVDGELVMAARRILL